MALIKRTAEDFAHAFMAALPVGEIWPRDRASVLYRRVRGLVGIVARWAERTAVFLLLEAFPPTSFDLLPDWERVCGLPDPCLPGVTLTLEERRAAVREKLAQRPGAQSRAYFIEIARRLGYIEPEPSPTALAVELSAEVGRRHEVTITEYRPFMAGVSRCGDPRWQIAPHQMRYVWSVRVPGQRLTWFRAGSGQAGVDPHLAIRRAEDLECMLDRLKPAHTRLSFDYTGD